MTRRRLLASTALLAVTSLGSQAFGRSYVGGSLPWEPAETQPPTPVRPGPWLYFTADEAAAVEAIVDRLIPPDESGPGGKLAGCAVFIDRQLAGSFGDSRRLYMQPPFANGTPSQGLQSPTLPKERYRMSIAALDDYCKAQFAGKALPRSTPSSRIKFWADWRRTRSSSRARAARNSSKRSCKIPWKFFCRPDLRRQSRHGGMEAHRTTLRSLRCLLTSAIPGATRRRRFRPIRSARQGEVWSAAGIEVLSPNKADRGGFQPVWRYRYNPHLLEGERPTDLLVQAPAKYETVVNLKAAKALGLEIPSSAPGRADKVNILANTAIGDRNAENRVFLCPGVLLDGAVDRSRGNRAANGFFRCACCQPR
jgi:hypothetical protein